MFLLPSWRRIPFFDSVTQTEGVEQVAPQSEIQAPRAQRLASPRHASSAEEVLERLLTAETPIIEQLHKAKALLAGKVLELIDDSRRCLLATKALREVVQTSNALSKRQQNLVVALTSLNAQRRFLRLHQERADGD